MDTAQYPFAFFFTNFLFRTFLLFAFSFNESVLSPYFAILLMYSSSPNTIIVYMYLNFYTSLKVLEITSHSVILLVHVHLILHITISVLKYIIYYSSING